MTYIADPIEYSDAEKERDIHQARRSLWQGGKNVLKAIGAILLITLVCLGGAYVYSISTTFQVIFTGFLVLLLVAGFLILAIVAAFFFAAGIEGSRKIIRLARKALHPIPKAPEEPTLKDKGPYRK